MKNGLMGGGFQCAKSTNPTCTINIADDYLASLVVSLFDSGYAMPIFKDVGIDTDGDGVRNALDEDDDNDGIFDIDDTCPLDPSPSCSEAVPLTDTVIINGIEWAQIDLFTFLSWNDINLICSGGPCSGVLKGYNMAGWAWASRADVNALYDFYICGPAAAGCFDGEEYAVNSAWAPMMFTDGMRFTSGNTTDRYIDGLVADVNNEDPGFVRKTAWKDSLPLSGSDSAVIEQSTLGVDQSGYWLGGWFYRTP